MRKPFKAGFSNFFDVSFLSSKWHVAEEILQKTWMSMIDERFPYDNNVVVG